MKTLTISKIIGKPGTLRKLLEEDGKARIVWKEPKPNGEVILSAIIKVEEQS